MGSRLRKHAGKYSKHYGQDGLTGTGSQAMQKNTGHLPTITSYARRGTGIELCRIDGDQSENGNRQTRYVMNFDFRPNSPVSLQSIPRDISYPRVGVVVYISIGERVGKALIKIIHLLGLFHLHIH